jgi:hypothetical protein
MNSATDAKPTVCPPWLRPAALTVFFVLFALAVVTHASFWLDEVVVAYIASRPTLGQW